MVYDPFFGQPQGFVSPLPGVGAAAGERLGRYYTLASGANPGQAQIAWGTVSGSAPNFSLGAGATLQRIGFDSAWRRTSVETFQDADTSYTVDYSWDAGSDRQTGVSFAGASQTQAYDFLGRPSTLTGPGASVSTTAYDQDNLAGWIATFYANTTLSAPGVTSESVNSAAVDWSSAPDGISGGSGRCSSPPTSPRPPRATASSTASAATPTPAPPCGSTANATRRAPWCRDRRAMPGGPITPDGPRRPAVPNAPARPSMPASPTMPAPASVPAAAAAATTPPPPAPPPPPAMPSTWWCSTCATAPR